MQTGLNKMGRNHVHLAIGLPGGEVISGMRASCQVVIDVNVAKAMLGPSKLPFYLSANNVVLCAGLQDGSVPSSNFRSVIDWKK
jgi:2'-phosphotransferase